MSTIDGLRAPMRRIALLGSTACLIASCSETASPPAATTTTNSTSPSTTPPTAGKTGSTAPPPAPVTGPLEKDWKSYGGTAYFGCPEKVSDGKSALEDIRPKIFDTTTGQYVTPGTPMVPAGEKLTGAVCALSGTADDMRVVYVLTTATAAQASEPATTKVTAYAFDLKSDRPVATKELQPPTPDLKLTAADRWGFGSTATGVAWVNAFTDGHAPASPPRTVVLSGTDLASLWDDPEQAQVWQDALAFHRNTGGATTSGAELRRPTGEPIYQDNDVRSVDAELSDGPDKLVKLTHWDSHQPPAVSTVFFDLNAKQMIKIGDSDKISGGGLAATLSAGKLFVDGRDSEDSKFGFGVWNLRTRRWDLLKSRDDAKKMSITNLSFFEDHLYITKADGTFSVLALPGTEPVASNWSVRPFGRISDWTLVCRGAASANGDCQEIVLVQDQDGRYPGPWF